MGANGDGDTLKVTKGPKLDIPRAKSSPKVWYDPKGKSHPMAPLQDKNTGKPVQVYSPTPPPAVPRFSGSMDVHPAQYADQLHKHTTGIPPAKKKTPQGKATFE